MTGAFTPVGKVISCFTIVLAVGVFAIPTGVLGSGLLDIFEKRRAAAKEEEDGSEPEPITEECAACRDKRLERSGFRGRVFLFSEGKTAIGRHFDTFILTLIAANVVAFMIDTIPGWSNIPALDAFEAVSVGIFTLECAAPSSLHKSLCTGTFVDRRCVRRRGCGGSSAGIQPTRAAWLLAYYC